ncbi:MAG: hypothetical protein HDT28_08125 [Clostridiales bacterium]|nr:hypothetical protein [Clostridiales bacterium]
MDIRDTVRELFDPTFEAVGDSDLSYDQKRTVLYNLYCFACAVYPEYVGSPCNTLFEYGCCFLIEPERHPDYSKDNPEFVHTAASSDALPSGGRWYKRRGKDFIKYDYGSALFDRLVMSEVIPPADRKPIEQISLYAAVYLVCNMFKTLRPLWYTYYFYLDATNEPVDEEFDDKLFELLHDKAIYKQATEVRGSMLIGDEVELAGADKLLNWYKPFIDLRRDYIFDVFAKRMASGDVEFVSEYSQTLLSCYPDSVALMNWNAAARTERVVRDRDEKALPELIRDLKDYAAAANGSPVLDKYLKLAELMKKNIDSNS